MAVRHGHAQAPFAQPVRYVWVSPMFELIEHHYYALTILLVIDFVLVHMPFEFERDTCLTMTSLFAHSIDRLTCEKTFFLPKVSWNVV